MKSVPHNDLHTANRAAELEKKLLAHPHLYAKLTTFSDPALTSKGIVDDVPCVCPAERSEKEATGSFGRYVVEIYDNGESINPWLDYEGLTVDYDR